MTGILDKAEPMRISPPLIAAVEATLEERTGRPDRILSASPVGGGCISPAARLNTEKSEPLFLKWNDDAPPEMFGAEADGLRALAQPGALRVPEVIGFGGEGIRGDPAWLLLEFIPEGAPGPDYGRRLGEGLARLHHSGEDPTLSGPTLVPKVGWQRVNNKGSQTPEKGEGGVWGHIWRDRRIAPQLARAREQGYFLGGEGMVLDRLMDRIEEFLPPDEEEGSALLHGDLWSGNYFPDPGGAPVLIDPAVYRGDGEVDLAMMELFGSFPGGFEEGYKATRTISTQYRSCRRDLYQLYYLLVHVNLFGGSYLPGSLAAAKRVLSS
jgi:protein-ribulosamine 3-kinase